MKKKLSFLMVCIFVIGVLFVPVHLVAEVSPWDPDDSGGGGYNAALSACYMSAIYKRYDTIQYRCNQFPVWPFGQARCIGEADSVYRQDIQQCHIDYGK